MLDLNDKKITGSAIKLNSADNVAVALSEIKAGTNLLGTNITTREIVPPGYKVAICDISQGDPIKKYDVTVGFAKFDIVAGTMLHNHNIEFREFDRDYSYAKH